MRASYWSPEHPWGGLLQNPYTSIRCQLSHCRNLCLPLQRLVGNGNPKMPWYPQINYRRPTARPPVRLSPCQ